MLFGRTRAQDGKEFPIELLALLSNLVVPLELALVLRTLSKCRRLRDLVQFQDLLDCSAAFEFLKGIPAVSCKRPLNCHFACLLLPSSPYLATPCPSPDYRERFSDSVTDASSRSFSSGFVRWCSI